MKVHQTVMMGSGGIGKSALTVQMVHGRVIDSYDPTIEDSYRTNVLKVDGEACLLEILDTAGQEQYTSLTELYCRNGESFMLVYSLTDHNSFLEVKELHQQIVRIKDAQGVGVPLVLVGNKCDLEEAREVDTIEGEQLAKSWSCPFYETSARKNLNVREAFIDVIRQCRIFEPVPPEQNLTNYAGAGGGAGRRRRRRKAKCTIL